MTEMPRALIVEDDTAFSEELALAADALGMRATRVDNKIEAIEQFAAASFSLVLLDLEIKPRPESLKGHPEAGWEVLRAVRAVSPARTGVVVIVVSGHAGAMPDAVELMAQGADYVLTKSNPSRKICDEIRRALRTRREFGAASSSTMVDGRRRLAVPATVVKKQHYRVCIGKDETALKRAPLRLLLRLIAAKLRGERLETAKIQSGAQALRRLRADLSAAGPSANNLIVSHGDGTCSLAGDVEVGECDVKELAQIDAEFRDLGEEIARLAAPSA
jgi:DNA-binding response OmpR family regulator